ncbi:MAG: dihydroorotase [Solobacterium sp.]|nr:dihydroorotase [Solobacterium sp.]
MRLIRNGTVLYKGSLQKKDILFDENAILQIADQIDADCEVIDASGLYVLPGLVDVHVHLREPGFEKKETIRTGTTAAAAGGFTSIFAMPNLNPYPDNAETMKEYLALIARESVVHTYPYGTITCGEKGQNVSDLAGMKELGIRWFSDDGVGVADEAVMKEAMEKAASLNVMIACHTEDMNYRKPGASVHESPYAEKNGWKGIPSACESEQLKRDLMIACTVPVKYHGCHISAKESVEALRDAKKNGADASAEVTAHHLLLEDKDVKGTNWKMNPPLRSHEDRLALIEALEDGTLDFIASDHAPHTKEDKEKPMAEAAFGIVSLETSFAMLYTEFVKKTGRWTLPQLVSWMSEKPAARFGLEKTGKIEEGWQPDLILADLDNPFVISAEKFYSKGKNTPFDGETAYGRVKETICGGRTVWKEKQE